MRLKYFRFISFCFYYIFSFYIRHFMCTHPIYSQNALLVLNTMLLMIFQENKWTKSVKSWRRYVCVTQCVNKICQKCWSTSVKMNITNFNVLLVSNIGIHLLVNTKGKISSINQVVRHLLTYTSFWYSLLSVQPKLANNHSVRIKLN